MTMNPPGTFDPASPENETSSTDSKEKAQKAAATAADEARNVAGTAKSEAKQVADEARSQVNDLMGQATSQVDDQARTQRDRLVGVLGSMGDDFDQMSSQGSGLAADLAQEAASRARGLSAHLDDREPRELLDDVRDFARRRPGTFLLGALVAGVVAGRLTRGARDAGSAPASSGPPPRHAGGTTPAALASTPDREIAATMPDPIAPADTIPGRATDQEGTGLGANAVPAAAPEQWSDAGPRGDR